VRAFQHPIREAIMENKNPPSSTLKALPLLLYDCETVIPYVEIMTKRVS
jgi:hypothetical protein